MIGKLEIILVVLAMIVALVNSAPVQIASKALQPISAQALGVLRIYGSVDTPLNLTYDELASFPMVSEEARLLCVISVPDVTYNWTGIPLFYLLTLAEIRPEAYKVVTRGVGGFESDLTIEDAMKPTTILALGANGTSLPEISGIQGRYRLVVPCKYGYKWVGDVEEIEAVTTDYKGTYESGGWSDEADVPDCGPLPALTPPIRTFGLSYGNRTFEVDVYTSASVDALVFNYFQKTLNINMTVPEGAFGFVEFILQQDFLRGPYNVTIDGKAIDAAEGDTLKLSYLYVQLSEGSHITTIEGTEFFGHIPQITVDYNTTAHIGQNTTFDASKSFDFGGILSYEWTFGDGAKATGPIVSHSYDEVGTYQVKLNVTNVEGISGFETLVVVVGNPPGYIPLPLIVFFAASFSLLVLILAILLRNRTRY